MFFNKFTKRQYKCYKYGLVISLLNSKEQAENLLKNGEIESYEEVPEQILYDGDYYDKFSLPFIFYVNFFKSKVYSTFKSITEFFISIINFLKNHFFAFVICIFVVSFVIFASYFGYKNIPENKDWIDFFSAIAPTIVSIISIIIAFYSIFYTRLSIKFQEEQWLKNEFIKRESHLLLNFREKFLVSYNSIFWFLNIFMREHRFGNFVPNEDQLTIKIETFNYHYNNLKELYDLYMENPLIYQKYKIDNIMNYITSILSSINVLNGKDLKLVFKGRFKNALVYDCKERINFVKRFTQYMDFAYCPVGKDIEKYLKNLSKKQKFELRFKKYLDDASAKFNELKYKLEEIITYHSKINNQAFTNVVVGIYCTAEDYFKTHCDINE